MGQQYSITLEGTYAVWGLQGQYLLLWRTTDSKQSTISVYETRDLLRLHQRDRPKPLRERGFRPGDYRYEAQMLEPLSWSDESVEVLIAETDAQGNRRVLIWDVINNTIKNQLMIPAERETRLIKTHPILRRIPTEKRVKDHLQSGLDDASFKFRIVEAVHPKLCISKNMQWLGTFSQKFQSCSIVSVKCGATVWSSGFAQPLQMGPFDVPAQPMFDSNGDHFLVMGECAIMVCAPEFIDDKPHTEERDQPFLEAYACLPSQSLASALEDREHNCGVSSWIDGLTSSIDHTTCISDATQSADGRRLASIVSIRETSSQPVRSTRIVCLEEGEGEALLDLAFEEDNGTEADSESFIPNRLFLYDNGNGPDQGLVAFSELQKPIAMFIDIPTKNKREKKLENIDRCLRISQTADRKKVTILDIRKVVIINLRSETTSEIIEYQVDFTNLLAVMIADAKWKRKRRDGDMKDTQKRVSDNGRCVLLSWDQGRQESIVVRPSSGLQDVKGLLKQPNRVLSDYCTLSSDGRATCFIDMGEIPNSRITIGIFNESGNLILIFTLSFCSCFHRSKSLPSHSRSIRF